MVGYHRARVPLTLAIAKTDLTVQGQVHLCGRSSHANRRDLLLDVERQGARLDQIEQCAFRIAGRHHQRRFDEAPALDLYSADRSAVETDPSDLGRQRDFTTGRFEGLLQRLRQSSRAPFDICATHTFVEQQARSSTRRPRAERGADRSRCRECRSGQRMAKRFLQPIGRTHGGHAHQLEHVGFAKPSKTDAGLAHAPEFGDRVGLHQGRFLAQHTRHERANSRQKAAPRDVTVAVTGVERLEFVARAFGFRMQHDALVVRVRGEHRRRFTLEFEAEARKAERIDDFAANTGAVVKQSGDRVARVHFARSAQSTHDGALLDDRHLAARAREQQPGHQSIVSGTDDDGATHTALALSMVFAHSCPGAAMIPPPGCAPAPHSQSFSIGVL